ncbi:MULTISPECIES: hypothetical protein [Micromonospora]|nr:MULTISPECIES: hypothetical protein [Micromonospora]
MPVSALDQHLKGNCRPPAHPGAALPGGDLAGHPATAGACASDESEVSR